ncbi:hypothetical protein VNO78_26657 [Psophocarpus tetragonolobus]|uniref:Uncharacterized protein n=1 Tax=Psophocarpus tetragonolobus TaxID=3891 RepID=A0AAN9S0Z7_PSOTE
MNVVARGTGASVREPYKIATLCVEGETLLEEVPVPPKLVRSRSSSKRSRAAEVHNLSEKVCLHILLTLMTVAVVSAKVMEESPKRFLSTVMLYVVRPLSDFFKLTSGNETSIEGGASGGLVFTVKKSQFYFVAISLMVVSN